MEKYIKMFSLYEKMPLDLVTELELNAVQSRFRKGDIIQVIGEPLDELVLIERGLVMASIPIGLGTRALWFKKEGDFIVSLRSDTSRELRAERSIEALEDTVVWSWSMDIVEELFRQFDEFNVCYMRILARDMLRMDDHHAYAGGGSASYYAFLKRYDSALLSRIPHRELASFMKISEKKLKDIMNSK